MLIPALLLVLQDAPLLEGLNPGEKAVAATAEEGWNESDFLFRRVHDARTGEPLAGVQVEVFNEDLSEPHRKLICLASRTSGPDGSIRIPLRKGDVKAMKVRFRKPGFVSLVHSTGMIHNDVYLFRAEPVRFRVQNLDGLPIPGARITLRQTCAHAPDTFSVTTDAFGYAEVTDFPDGETLGGVHVEARGYGRSGMGGLTARMFQARDGEVLVYLAQRLPRRFRILDRRGQPVADRRVIDRGGDGWSTARTDSEGRLEIRSPLESPESVLGVLEPEREDFVGVVDPPDEREIPLRLGSQDSPVEESGMAVPVSLTRVGSADEIEDLPRGTVQVFHEDGHHVRGVGDHLLPPGRVRLVIGGDFTGWRQELRELELAAGGLRLELDPQPEPRLTVQLPEEGIWSVQIQAGDDSVGHGHDGGSESFPVPPGKAITVLARAHQGGEVRRVDVPPLEDDATVRMDTPECVLVEGLAMLADDAERSTVRFLFRDPDGEAVQLSNEMFANAYSWACGWGSVSEKEVEIAAGSPFVAEFGADGHQTAWVRGNAPEPGKTLDFTVTLRPLATVRVNGPVARARGGGRVALQRDDARILEVAPGPLRLLVEREDGQWIAVQLDLAPGDDRVLTVD